MLFGLMVIGILCAFIMLELWQRAIGDDFTWYPIRLRNGLFAWQIWHGEGLFDFELYPALADEYTWAMWGQVLTPPPQPETINNLKGREHHSSLNMRLFPPSDMDINIGSDYEQHDRPREGEEAPSVSSDARAQGDSSGLH